MYPSVTQANGVWIPAVAGDAAEHGSVLTRVALRHDLTADDDERGASKEPNSVTAFCLAIGAVQAVDATALPEFV